MWRVHCWHLESLFSQSSSALVLSKLASNLSSVLHFQTPDRQVTSVTQPVPNIQVPWKLVSEAVGFSRCNALVCVVQEQSEDKQLILVLFFHAEVLGGCFGLFLFVVLFCLINKQTNTHQTSKTSSSMFKIRTGFENPMLLHRIP